jgi:hypothetical protein
VIIASLAVFNICTLKSTTKYNFMLAEINNPLLDSTTSFEKEVTTKVKSNWINKARNKIKYFFQWINPKNWFSSIADSEINMNEFACKKTVTKE